MKPLQTYWFKPKNQVDGQPEVEFELRPLNQRALNDLFSDWHGERPGTDGALAAAKFAVVNWRGLPQPFSPAALRDLFDGDEPNMDATLWLFSIVGEAFQRATLKAAAAKNSESPSTSQ